MTETEVRECMNLYKALWNGAFKEPTPERKKMYFSIWQRQLGSFVYKDVEEALYYINATNDSKYEPSMKLIIDTVKMISKQNGNSAKGSRRIVTPEEIRSQLYIETKDERYRSDYLLFHGEGWEQRYQQHFGTTKTREEYERL